MRHADIRTTVNIYGDAVTGDMSSAREKVVSTEFLTFSLPMHIFESIRRSEG
jgi:hypothetical protein